METTSDTTRGPHKELLSPLELKSFGVVAIDVILFLALFPAANAHRFFNIALLIIIASISLMLFFVWHPGEEEKQEKYFNFGLDLTLLSLILIFWELESSLLQALIPR